MQVWNVPNAARWEYRTPKMRLLRTIAQVCRAISSQLRHVSTNEKNLLSSNTSSTCFDNMVNVGPLTAEIGCWLWGTPANFNGFCVFASLLLARSFSGGQPYVARCLAVSRAGTLYIEGLHFCSPCSWRNFARCKIYFASKSCVLLLAALLYGTPAACVSHTLRRGIFMRQGGRAVRHWAV